MKGQFFISSVVVIAVILIVSMTYANSAEELRIESTSDLEFDNYRNAYQDALPDDWGSFTDYEKRVKIGVCASNPSDTSISNTSVQFIVETGGPAACTDFKTSFGTTYISSDILPCWLFFKPSAHSSNYNSLNCTEFYVYYDGPAGDTTTTTPDANVNGTKFNFESIEITPHDHMVSNYREKNILLEETSKVNHVYSVIYKSDRIDYTGQL